MRCPAARVVALVALAAAAVTAIDPSAAFTSGSLDRDVHVEVVADSQAYNAITGGTTCNVLRSVGGSCSITVANKGAATMEYYATLDPASSRIAQYKIGGSSYVASGRTGSSGTISSGSTTTLAVSVYPCLPCSTELVYFTVEGEKSDTLSSIETRIKLTIHYS